MRIRLGSAIGWTGAVAVLLACAVPLRAETVAATSDAAATEAEPTAGAAPDVQTDGPVPDALMKEGETLFLRNCRQCHGTRGTAGVPLKQNENIADASYVASVILVGPGYMAGFADALNDDQIAAISTYVRNSWGNAYGAVTPQDVADMR